MGKKKKSWLTYVKRLFISESKTKSGKVTQKWKNSRSLLKFRKYPAIEAPARTLNDAEEQQIRAIAVATAAAAAAEAAVAAAAAAAEVARLSHELRRKNINLQSAATKIQTYYRGYLARKALSALKGVVRLQAVLRGELARRYLIHLQRSGMVQEIEIPNSNAESLGTTKLAQLKLRSAMKQGKTEGRRSFSHAKEKPRRDDHNAHSFPAYMATTESAKAKVRSSITPKQRRLSLSESSYSCQESSPSKLIISSFNTELIFNA